MFAPLIKNMPLLDWRGVYPPSYRVIAGTEWYEIRHPEVWRFHLDLGVLHNWDECRGTDLIPA
jgi:hypothetical protein